MRVRRLGKSYAHPFLILIVQKVDQPFSRFAVSAGTSIGNAVKRNRAKRLLRSALNTLIKDIHPGYNGILIARKPLVYSKCEETKEALESLFRQAELVSSKINE